MVSTTRTFEQIALEEPDRQWELHDGQLREKPSMATAHNDLMFELGHQLRLQLGRREFRVRVNAGHLFRPTTSYFIPDVAVIPAELVSEHWDRPDILEAYRVPLPFMADVWSPSAGGCDVDDKLPEYQARGDAKIWRLHPYERTLTARRRQPDGT